MTYTRLIVSGSIWANEVSFERALKTESTLATRGCLTDQYNKRATRIDFGIFANPAIEQGLRFTTR